MEIRSSSHHSIKRNKAVKRSAEAEPFFSKDRKIDNDTALSIFLRFANAANTIPNAINWYKVHIIKDPHESFWNVEFYFETECVFRKKASYLEMKTIREFLNCDGTLCESIRADSINAYFESQTMRSQKTISKLFYDDYSRRNKFIKEINAYISVMETICSLIEDSGTANMVNMGILKFDHTTKLIMKIRAIEDGLKRYSLFLTEKIANCGELAFLTWVLLKNLDVAHGKTVYPYLFEHDDHVVVIIGDPKDNNSIVLDPWIKYLDLPKKHLWRSIPSKAKDRTRGFCGTLAEYTRFLNSHPNTFVAKRESYTFKMMPNISLIDETTLDRIYKKMMEFIK